MSTKRKSMSESDSDSPQMKKSMKREECDVIFVIDGKRLPAKKDFLSTHNKVFRAMFSGNSKESKDKDKEVVIEDTTFEAFKTIIEFIYTDQMVLNEDEDDDEEEDEEEEDSEEEEDNEEEDKDKLIKEVYKLSEKYEVKGLLDKIAKHLQTIDVNKDNIEFISKIADRSKDTLLEIRARTFLAKSLNVYSGKDDKQLIEMNDSTHNNLLKEVFNKYRELKKELQVASTKLSKIRCEACQNCNWPLHI